MEYIKLPNSRKCEECDHSGHRSWNKELCQKTPCSNDNSNHSNQHFKLRRDHVSPPPEMKQKFYPEDVGKPVTYVKTDLSLIHTEIVAFREGAKYPVVIEKNRLTITEYGTYTNSGICRLFHGHNIKVEISGEEIPKRKVKRYLNVRVQKGEGLLASLWNRKADAESIAEPNRRYILIAHEVEIDLE